MRPYDFQLKTIKSLERFSGRAIIASDTGLGKTYTALWFVERKTLGETLPLLIVCPKVIKTQWSKAVKKILKTQPLILESTRPYKTLPAHAQVVIINYDITYHWKDVLLAHNFCTTIIDECQAVTNPRAKRTKSVLAIARKTKFCIALSATPLTNRPIELFPIINCLKPNIWNNRMQYIYRYCNPTWTPWGLDYRGASNIPELHNKLKQSCMIRYTTSEVLQELPQKIRRVIPIEIANREQYDLAERDFKHWLKLNYPERQTSSSRALALVKIGYLIRLASKLKLRTVVNFINYKLENSNEKIVVFATHRKCIDVLERRIRAKNVVVDGRVTGPARDAAIKQFRGDPDTRVFIGNIAAAGVGLDLIEAGTLYCVELPLKPGPLIQMEGRIHRIGQKQVCQIIYFIAKHTIEETILRLLRRKQQVISGTLDGKKSRDFDLVKLLIDKMYYDATRRDTTTSQDRV